MTFPDDDRTTFRDVLTVLALLAALLVSCCIASVANGKVIGQWFSPRGGCTKAIVEQIDKAQKSIDYRMYNFTSLPVSEALQRAAERGVKVRILLDGREADKEVSQSQECAAAGCLVYADRKHAISHNKARIFDGKLVMFGSFNDTRNAEERNSEELVLEDDPKVVAKFAENFAAHWKHAERLESK